MARVTVEDCVLRVPNRFDLVMLAAKRARGLAAGAPVALDRDNDKNPVVALREIADGLLELDTLRDDLIRGHQRLVDREEGQDEIGEAMSEPEWAQMSQRERGDDASDGEGGDDLAAADGEDEELGDGEPGSDEIAADAFDDGVPFD